MFHECIVCTRGTVGVLFASGIVMVVLIVDEKLAKTPHAQHMLEGRLALSMCEMAECSG